MKRLYIVYFFMIVKITHAESRRLLFFKPLTIQNHEQTQTYSVWVPSFLEVDSVDELVSEYPKWVVGLSGLTENIGPKGTGPHYGSLYGEFGEYLYQEKGEILVFTPLPEHEPDGQVFQTHLQRDLFTRHVLNFLKTLQDKNVEITGGYGNSTGAVVWLWIWKEFHRTLKNPLDFNLFLSSPAIDIHMPLQNKILAFLLRSDWIARILAIFMPFFYFKENPNFKKEYPLFEHKQMESFDKFSIYLMTAFLEVAHRPEGLLKTLNQADSANLMIAYSSRDQVVKTRAIEKLISTLPKWTIHSKSYDDPGHSLPMTDKWGDVQKWFLKHAVSKRNKED